jgi:flagellar protein FliO/FliZ
MTQSLVLVGLFLCILVCIPSAAKWIKARRQGDSALPGEETRFVSAVAVGPQQRVVTVETGPVDDRVRLTLGVTSQSITCLHVATSGGRQRQQGQMQAVE